MRALAYIGAEKITFPPKPDRRTDISVYRVASLLKIKRYSFKILLVSSVKKEVGVK